jgi:hypothetical protein
LIPLLIATCLSASAFAQAPAGSPPLFFKEEWKAPTDVEHPVSQESVAGANLELKLTAMAWGHETGSWPLDRQAQSASDQAGAHLERDVYVELRICASQEAV